MPKVIINQDLCSRCNSCVEVCPAEIFISTKGEIPIILDAVADKFCISCGHCVAICPKNAINHKNFPEGRVNPIKQDLLPSSDQIREMLRSIRSIREFKDIPVEKEIIEDIIDVARFAPSSTNMQTTEYVVVQNKDVLNKIVDLTYSYLAKMSKLLHNQITRSLIRLALPKNAEEFISYGLKFDRYLKAQKLGKDKILYNAPLLLIFHANKMTPFAEANANLALHNAYLYCWGHGLGSFYTGFVVQASHHDRDIQRLVSVPPSNKIYGALAIGYPRVKYNKWVERKNPKVKWIE